MQVEKNEFKNWVLTSQLEFATKHLSGCLKKSYANVFSVAIKRCFDWSYDKVHSGKASQSSWVVTRAKGLSPVSESRDREETNSRSHHPHQRPGRWKSMVSSDTWLWRWHLQTAPSLCDFQGNLWCKSAAWTKQGEGMWTIKGKVITNTLPYKAVSNLTVDFAIIQDISCRSHLLPFASKY